MTSKLNEPVKLLGIYLDARLDWKPHTNYVCKRLSRVVFLLRNLADKINLEHLKQAYFAFFESILRYGLLLYGNGSGLKYVLKSCKSDQQILIQGIVQRII